MFSDHVERKLALQNSGILGSSPTPARFDLNEHRTGVRSCINGVFLVRPNRRLNALAIDTRNTEVTKALLGFTSLGGIPVIAYEPILRELAAAVIYQVPVNITEAELQSTVRATALVISISRLGRSESVKVVFSTDTLPGYVTVGYTRFKLQPYIEKPRQCWKCGRVGHVRTACT
ncbi:hypothetical protein HPB47_007584 [Ixodes persulcatus]|uniref:Uncharacterized protein n=1 Tax=Ixodes persulcatus TaxID=34615 RepID=A0AC60P7E8_IXOPE|nr:hypothetical protein HPB47_007584 [Ixodes persulcatus]